jgi:hypothetical protein
MENYQLCEMGLQSNIPFPELIPSDRPGAEYSFEYLAGTDYRFPDYEWFHHHELPDGQRWISYAKKDDGYILRFYEIGDYLVSLTDNRIRCYPQPDIPLESIRHLLIDSVIPMVLNQQGHVVLHAGAVVLQQNVVAFLGLSGRGKSTLTANFYAQGFQVLTDDCLLLREREGSFYGIPSYPGIRLWDDNLNALFSEAVAVADVAHYTGKKRLILPPDSFLMDSARLPLAKIFVLNEPEEGVSEIKLTRLSARESFMELVQHTFQLDIKDRSTLAKNSNLFSRLAGTGMFYRLSYPRELALLPEVRAAIIAAVEN